MERRLAAILIADVAGYSRLSHRDEEGTRSRFLAHLNGLVQPKITEHGGRLIKTMGDGLLVEFPSIVNALRCAIDIQQADARANADISPDKQLRFRIGINLGDVIAEGDDVHGDGVNIAHRLQNLAEPGGIVISGSAYDYAKNKLDVSFESLGEQRVKNIDEPVRAYRIRLDGAPVARRRASLLARRWAIAAPIAIAVALIAAGSVWWFRTGGVQPALAAPAVAVLPFDKLSGDPASGRMADGITEDIITDLSRYRDFAVIARDSTAVYKGKPVDVRQIGKDLNVSHILEGSFQHEGNQVRISAQLIDAATGVHVWSERYDRPAGEVFAIQSEVADRIANSLGGHEGHVGASMLTAAKRKLPSDLSAYELYLLGQEKMHTGMNDESQLEAESLFEQAIKIDPTFARAHVQLAWSYSWRATYEADRVTLNEKMIEEARRAVELDPMDADAHQALGYALSLSGDLEEAEIQMDEALRLNPNAFDILVVYACMAHNFGKAKAGAEGVDRAMRLNPNYPAWAIPCFRLGLVMVGRYEDAVKVQARQPEDQWNTDGFVITAGSLAKLGRLDEAKTLVAHGIAKYPGQLNIEKFALNGGWPASASAVILDLMRKAGFPACASDKDLAGIAKPVRLPRMCEGWVTQDCVRAGLARAIGD
jgi:TolB-like protein/class 3 adenylate cyclase/Tfp pilus assembly protein PilF